MRTGSARNPPASRAGPTARHSAHRLGPSARSSPLIIIREQITALRPGDTVDVLEFAP
jgi:molybdopterin biosynthesis enzyme